MWTERTRLIISDTSTNAYLMTYRIPTLIALVLIIEYSVWCVHVG